MKNLKKVLAILLTAIIMLSITTVFAGAVNEERVNRIGYSSKNDAGVQDDFKISKIFRLGEGDFLSKEEILKYVDIKGADGYSVGSFYQFADICDGSDEDYEIIGFTSDNGNCIDIISVYVYNIVDYNEEYGYYDYEYIGEQYFLLVVNTDGEDMGEIESMSINDSTFTYKSEGTWMFPSVKTKANNGAYWIEYYTMDDYSETPYVFYNGYVDTYKTGTSHVTCYVIDAEGNVFSDNCTVTVKLTFLQWIIKYLCFGWLWGF